MNQIDTCALGTTHTRTYQKCTQNFLIVRESIIVLKLCEMYIYLHVRTTCISYVIYSFYWKMVANKLPKDLVWNSSITEAFHEKRPSQDACPHLKGQERLDERKNRRKTSFYLFSLLIKGSRTRTSKFCKN